MFWLKILIISPFFNISRVDESSNFKEVWAVNNNVMCFFYFSVDYFLAAANANILNMATLNSRLQSDRINLLNGDMIFQDILILERSDDGDMSFAAAF